ncbi:MAG: PorV/PorQ family protein [Elusimicrobia bacterium]|nr:PorV/PorQ family protein [Elusimicrobiota bacterium]
MKKVNSIEVRLAQFVVALLVGMSVGLSQGFASFSEKDAGTRTAQFLKLPVGARAIGMGEAYTAVADDANAIFYNVAGLARLDKKSGEYMFSKYVEETSYHWVGYAMPISESLGSAGIGFQYFSAGDLDETNLTANKVGTFSPSDLAINLSYAKKWKEFPLGATLKIINSKIKESATTVAIDLGAQHMGLMNGKVDVGFAIQNLGGGLKFESESSKLPLLIKLGSAYKASENWVAALDLIFPEDNSAQLALGTDYKYQVQEGMTLSGRLGYNSRSRKVEGFNGVTIGLGFGFQMATLDYAWMPLGDLGSTHRVSVGVKF